MYALMPNEYCGAPGFRRPQHTKCSFCCRLGQAETLRAAAEGWAYDAHGGTAGTAAAAGDIPGSDGSAATMAALVAETKRADEAAVALEAALAAAGEHRAIVAALEARMEELGTANAKLVRSMLQARFCKYSQVSEVYAEKI